MISTCDGVLGDLGAPPATPAARAVYASSVASIVMAALSTFDTGQPCSACLAIASKPAWSVPGTFAFTVRCALVMVKPSPSFSRVIVDLVSILSAVRPAALSKPDSAMLKQPACAAPSSSSGLVPGPSSKRDLNPYGASLRTPVWLEMTPWPSLIPPCHTADPHFCMMLSSLVMECRYEHAHADPRTLPAG